MAQNGRKSVRQMPDQHGFTLIELILVMTILTIAVSITAPALANFFRGRSLDSEARRLLSLTRAAQSRAASEGIPVDLWVDSTQNAYGVIAESSYEPTDSKAVNFTLDSEIKIEAVALNASSTSTPSALSSNTASDTHPNSPRIRFLPDGTIADSSPQMIRLTGRDDRSLWLMLSRDGSSYEIRNTPK